MSARSKFDADPFLFKPEPPAKRALVKALFHGRQKALEKGVAVFQRYLDVKGRRGSEGSKSPWIIHGESRSGKSHLARRLLAEMPDDNRCSQIVVSARDRLDAAVVMRRIFEELFSIFKVRVLDVTRKEDPLRDPVVRLVDQLATHFTICFAPAVGEVTFALEESEKNAVEAGVDAGTPLLKFLAKYQDERSLKRTTKVTLRPPGAMDLAELCGIMADTMVRFKLADHLLVLVDDVDLLEQYMSEARSGRIQRSVLSDALLAFHDFRGVDVLITSRSWYAHSRKEFHELIDLSDHELDWNALVEIYRRRREVLWPRGTRYGFLNADALKLLASSSQNLPGVFLRHVNTAWGAYQDEADDGERDRAWLVSMFSQRFRNIRKKSPAAGDALLTAAREGRQEIPVQDQNPFLATMFDEEWVFQSYHDERIYKMTGLIRTILERLDSGTETSGS